MKKTLLLFAAIFSLLTFSFRANAKEFKAILEIDHPERVSVQIDYEDLTDLKESNEITGDYSINVTLQAKPGFVLVSVTQNEDGFEWLEDNFTGNNTGIDFRIYAPYDEGVVMLCKVVTAPEADTNTASFTINIDDPSKAKVELVKSDKILELNQGENVIEFNPDVDSQLKISPTGKDLYQVKLNGEVQKTSWSYTLTIKDKDVVDIATGYPDIDCKVKFVLTGDEVEDFIKRVEVDGQYADNYLAPDFTVKCGSVLTIYGDNQTWEVLSFTINGEGKYFSNPTTIPIDQDAEIAINVQKYATFKVTVNIDDPSHIILYNGYHYNGNVVELQKGANVVDVIRSGARLEIEQVDGFYIESITFDDDSGIDESDLRDHIITLAQLYADDVINITTGVINRDRNAMLYVSNLAEAADYFKITRADGKSPIESLSEGYNAFSFYERDNSFTLETGAPINAYVYQNDEAVSPTYPESPKYTLDLSHNHVVKVYFANEAPVKQNVTIEADPEVLDGMTLKRDHIVDADNWESGFAVLPGTHCSLTPNREGVIVTYNGAQLSPDAEGTYNFTVDKDATLKVEDPTTGIGLIEADDAMLQPVYNLQGVKVRNNSSVDAMKDLTPGIYIIGGKKYLVK